MRVKPSVCKKSQKLQWAVKKPRANGLISQTLFRKSSISDIRVFLIWFVLHFTKHRGSNHGPVGELDPSPLHTMHREAEGSHGLWSSSSTPCLLGSGERRDLEVFYDVAVLIFYFREGKTGTSPWALVSSDSPSSFWEKTMWCQRQQISIKSNKDIVYQFWKFEQI